eukprot:8019681-Pyramimonas_sp.AAC.1
MTHLVSYANLVDSLGRHHQAKSPVADIQTVLRVRKVDGSHIFARGRRGRRGMHNGPAARQRTQGIRRRSPHRPRCDSLSELHPSARFDGSTQAANTCGGRPTVCASAKLMGAKYSFVDVVVCITGQRSDHAKRAFDDVLRIDPNITHLVSYVNLVDSLGRQWRTSHRLRVRKVDGSQIFARGRR